MADMGRPMNLRQIEVFRAVMATGSTVDAARLLHVSQPGVSRMIRYLESRLDVPLFERIRGRLVATPEAVTLHTEIERVYRGVQHVQDVAAHLRFGAHATLRVLASANTALELVPGAIAKLVRRYPQTSVQFEAVPTREIVKQLVAEEADLAISSAAVDHPALAVHEIGRWALLCAVPATGPGARASPTRVADAVRAGVITYSPEAPQSPFIEALLQRHGVVPVPRVEVRSGFAACSLVAAGVGVAFVDDLSARAHRRDGVRFIPVPRAPRFPLYRIANANRPPSISATAFVALVSAELSALQRRPLR